MYRGRKILGVRAAKDRFKWTSVLSLSGKVIPKRISLWGGLDELQYGTNWPKKECTLLIWLRSGKEPMLSEGKAPTDGRVEARIL